MRHLGSTIGLTTLGSSLAVLSRFAPQAAGRRAARMWCSPPAKAGKRKDNRPGDGVLTAVRGGNGERIVVEAWGEGPTILLAHGWGGWRGHLGAFVEPLVAAGFRVVGFDAPSHGESDPGEFGRRRSHGGELARSLALVAAEVGPAHAVIAHSLGCAATTIDIANGTLLPDELVFISPSQTMSSYVDAFTNRLHLTPRAAAATTAEIERMAGLTLRDFDIAALGARGLAPAPLVVHDRCDGESSYGAGVRIAQSWPGAELMTTNGLGHLRILRDPDVVRAVVDHVAAPARATMSESEEAPGT